MTFGEAPRRRRPSLTPMIDVVFLLLVFFMLAARFGLDQTIPLPLAGSSGDWSGPPRLVDIRPDGLTLNGAPVAGDELASALAPLTATPDDTIVLRARDGADVQRLIDVAERLTEAGFSALVLVE
ncbi:biopolymer transporter ExbD [Pikeienuella piscinae]|uniref:Biopolymer transporter ExbD n=1 Tax=Pikeienuella piscinae TaxID=2748098 RepID=A0A7M3T744_9RHOB|nr:biopolymer transporter ExbD [Pikeienuella piscinae]QIE57825.1 biopolymer transporter ExbD [Pikeienuella piscinae]